MVGRKLGLLEFVRAFLSAVAVVLCGLSGVEDYDSYYDKGVSAFR